MKFLFAFFSVFSIFCIGAERHSGDSVYVKTPKTQIEESGNFSTFTEEAKDQHKSEYEFEQVIEKETDHYTPDNNPVTWDEEPGNYPLETPVTYENVDDEEVQSPTHYKHIPQGACAICRDGTYSFSKNRRGTCSHHGGVAEWLK